MATSFGVESNAGHPYDFHVSGPRNLSSLNWRDLISSSWKDGNYRRTVMACFIQAVYLLELDRQERRTEEDGIASKWWKPFKYKLAQTLVDVRDGSIYGALFEWDRSSALSDFILMKPSGAPKAVLALRGTLLKGPTFRRDLEDDLRFLTWESLKGSVRFKGALEALLSASDKFGSSNICIAGHSLGAGFALQVGKVLAKQGIYVESHLFNPPSISVAMSLRNVGESVGMLWNRITKMFPFKGAQVQSDSDLKSNNDIKVCSDVKKWVPHLYVNNSDYICCYYNDLAGVNTESQSSTGNESIKSKMNNSTSHGSVGAKLFVISKGKQKFLEAHGLQQWWSDNMELQLAVNNSKLIDRQLRSLYTLPNDAQAQ